MKIIYVVVLALFAAQAEAIGSGYAPVSVAPENSSVINANSPPAVSAPTSQSPSQMSEAQIREREISVRAWNSRHSAVAAVAASVNDGLKAKEGAKGSEFPYPSLATHKATHPLEWAQIDTEGEAPLFALSFAAMVIIGGMLATLRSMSSGASIECESDKT